MTVLKIQHQLGNHAPQTQALLGLGVAPENLHWIDIPYTSTPAVRVALRGLGIPLRTWSAAPFACWTSTRPSSGRECSTRLAATLELLRAIDYGLPAWATEYMSRMESTHGEAYSELATDVRDYIAYAKSQSE